MKQIDNHSLIRVTIIVSIIAIFGKFIGFARQSIIAAYYGVNSATDAFFLAQNMPAMMFPAVCSSISTAFISVYVTKTMQEGEQAGNSFASRAIVASLLVALLLSGIALIFAPYIVPIFAPGFKGETLTLAIYLTRLTMGSFVLIMAHYMLAAVLNSKKLFYSTQIAGLICNIFIISFTLFLGKGQSVSLLTLTIVGGHLIQALVLFAYSRKKVTLTINANPFHKDVKGLMVLALPILLGNSVVQLHNIVDKALASMLTEGAISALSYSNTLNIMVITIFITSLSTVLYPTLTEKAAINDMNAYGKNLSQSFIMLIMVLLPVSIITIIFSSDIVSIIYERGSFDHYATELTATALKFYAIQYVFVAIREVFIRGFYALKDTKTPMINGSIAVGLNIVFSILLAPRIGIAGIALGTSISSIISAFLLFWGFLRRFSKVSFKMIIPSIIKMILSCGVTTVFLLLFRKEFQMLMPLLRFILVTIFGFGIYGCLLLLLRCKEVIVGKTLIIKKLKKYKK